MREKAVLRFHKGIFNLGLRVYFFCILSFVFLQIQHRTNAVSRYPYLSIKISLPLLQTKNQLKKNIKKKLYGKNFLERNKSPVLNNS